MIEKISRLALDNAKMVLIGLLVTSSMAVFFARELKLDALPDITSNQVLILTNAMGLTPDEVERFVTRPVEVALGGTPGLKSQRSLSRYGVSQVVAVFDDDVDTNLARQLVQERMASLDLPDGVDSPVMGPPTGGLGEVYHFALRSSQRTGRELLTLAERRIRPILSRVSGVVEVNTWGGNVGTFEVKADALLLAKYNLTLADLVTALNDATGTQAGAALATADGQAYLRGARRPKDAAELGDIVVAVRADLQNGAQVEPALQFIRVNQVADVGEGSPPRTGAATANGGGELVYVMVQMLQGANALEVTAALDAQMKVVKQALPRDVEVDLIYDRSDMVIATLKTVGTNLLEGGLLVILVLFVMLGSLRAGLLVAAIIPLSMLFALSGMVFFDIPGNLMSLGAIDFGLLVDGGVVVIETVFHLRMKTSEQSRPMGHTVGDVMQRVSRPVFYAMLIIILAYLPILLLTGVDGKLFRPMASTVVMALLAALVLSLTVLPAAASFLLRDKDIPKRPTLPVRLLQNGMNAILKVLLPRQRILMGASLLAMVIGGVLAFRAGTAFVPQLDEGDLVVQTTRRPDITLKQAAFEAGLLEKAFLDDVPEVLSVYSRIGSPAVATDIMGLEQADVFVRLHPQSKWRKGKTKDGIIVDMQNALEKRGLGGDPAFTQPIQMRFNEMLGGDVSDVAVSLYSEDLAVLQKVGQQVRAAIAKVPGAVDVRLSSPPDVLISEVVPSPERAARVGLSERDVLDVVGMMQQGIEVGETAVDARPVPILVRLKATPDPWSLGAVRIPIHDDHAAIGASSSSSFGSNRSNSVGSISGGLAALSDVAEVHLRPTAAVISHDEGQRRVVVGFNIRGADLGDVTKGAQKAIDALELPHGVWIAWGGQAESLAAAKKRIGVLVPLVLVLILLVLVMALGSFRSAFIVLSHVPFASVGGIVALTLRNMPISISAAIGFIALSGIALLNGVVLMSEILEQEKQGLSPGQAAILAAGIRSRPVVMTALVAALGFLPMMVSTGIGAEVQTPLATVIVGGLVSSTLLTLIVLPSLYPLFAKRED